MQTHTVSVTLFPPFRRRLAKWWLTQVVSAALAVHPEEGAASVDVVIADDETVRRLNHTYRGLDEVTDVLAFAFTHAGPYEGEGEPPPYDPTPWPQPPGIRHLGEVVLCYPQAVRQAQQAGRPVQAEVAHLIIHGVLHLLGYDHQEPAQEIVMQKLERQALEMLGLSLRG
ncbi:MAG: rRNA maturation RNase YbeY [Dehalococcoidia bacterium]|nr:rRNA maturation RNase YbeY [Dehalococcoidia bacterium]MDW8119407.1 rRNA maturation RNase YbeY [Chloroflexota bacterium]